MLQTMMVHIRTIYLPPCVTHLGAPPYNNLAFCRGLIAYIASRCGIEGRMAAIVGVPYGFRVHKSSAGVEGVVKLSDATDDEGQERLEFILLENLPEIFAGLRKVEVPTPTGRRVCRRSLLPGIVELTTVLFSLFDSLRSWWQSLSRVGCGIRLRHHKKAGQRWARPRSRHMTCGGITSAHPTWARVQDSASREEVPVIYRLPRLQGTHTPTSEFSCC